MRPPSIAGPVEPVQSNVCHLPIQLQPPVPQTLEQTLDLDSRVEADEGGEDVGRRWSKVMESTSECAIIPERNLFSSFLRRSRWDDGAMIALTQS